MSEYRARIIASKKYYCSACDRAFRDKTVLNKHLNGLVHHPERKVNYECGKCNFKTRFLPNWTRHLKTKKHAKQIMNAVLKELVLLWS